jgi:hypothetical protein
VQTRRRRCYACYTPQVIADRVHLGLEVSVEEVRKHLDLLFLSSSFAGSKRCQEFLRYIVLEVVEGRADQINERNIAHEVFGKGTSFEPSEDSLVRVKAREVRKRLTDYYQTAPDSSIKIELPLGGYIPLVQRSLNLSLRDNFPDQEASSPARPMGRRRFAWILGGMAGAFGITSVAIPPLLQLRSSPLDLLWRPIFASKAPLLIFIPVMQLKDGSITEWVGIGPSAIYGRAAQFLTRYHYPYQLRFGSDLTFSQMREQPSLLLGGFYSMWTLMMTHNLRFAPLSNDNKTEQAFIDTQTKQIWKPVQHPPNPYVDVDYGILCRLFDAETRQISLVAVGTRTFGTEGAAGILFDPNSFADVLQHAPHNWETKNFEALIRVSVIGTTPSSPQVIATYFW